MNAAPCIKVLGFGTGIGSSSVSGSVYFEFAEPVLVQVPVLPKKMRIHNTVIAYKNSYKNKCKDMDLFKLLFIQLSTIHEISI